MTAASKTILAERDSLHSLRSIFMENKPQPAQRAQPDTAVCTLQWMGNLVILDGPLLLRM